MTDKLASERGEHGHFKKGHHIRKPNKTTTAKKMAQATEEGKLKALKKISFWDKLQDKILETIGKIDILELASVFATAVIIKTGIDWTETAVAQTATGQNPFLRWFDLTSLIRLGPALGGAEVTSEQKQGAELLQQLANSPTAEVMEWALSFVAAYLFIQRAKTVTTGDIGSVLGFAKGFLVGLL